MSDFASVGHHQFIFRHDLHDPSFHSSFHLAESTQPTSVFGLVFRLR
jgi:hypothetical protein